MTLRAALLVALVISGTCVRFSVHTARPVASSAHLSAEAAAQAFRQGVEAAALGQSIASCPFTGEEAARAWKSGWKWWGGG